MTKQNLQEKNLIFFWNLNPPQNIKRPTQVETLKNDLQENPSNRLGTSLLPSLKLKHSIKERREATYVISPLDDSQQKSKEKVTEFRNQTKKFDTKQFFIRTYEITLETHMRGLSSQKYVSLPSPTL